jgi:integrase
MVTYFSGIRPKEVLALKISDIHFERKLIIIKPNLETENSKTKTVRMVPVNDHLAAILLEHTQDHPTDKYVFGSPFMMGIGNRGGGSQPGGRSGANRTDCFQPSYTQIKRDSATKLWKKLIIDGLKIRKYMYSLKYTGSDDKILAGISLDALREMYGHSSKRMTERYAKIIKKVYATEIISKTPNF